jgi:putative Ca2+/H+ antiporter (TMEM165/GDT1 family)
MLTAFVVSVAAIAVGEIGDRRNFALMLAARYRQPWPRRGILARRLPTTRRGLLGSCGAIRSILRSCAAIAVAFFIVAAWALVDKLDEHDATASRHGEAWW